MSDEQAPQRRATDLPPDAPWWAKWLVANIDQAWKWASVYMPVACGSLVEGYADLDQATQQNIRDSINSLIPDRYKVHSIAALFLAFAVARVLRRPKKD